MNSIKEISYEILVKLKDWWESAILMLPNFIMAVLVVIAFVLLAKLARKGVRKVLINVSENRAVTKLLSTLVYISVILLGTFFALGILDLDKTVTSLLAGVGVIGLALGFAFQNTAANFISGVFMVSGFPLSVGDMIETNGEFGIVQVIGIRYTTMRSFKGQIIVIPNKDILEDTMINYTVTNERRVDIDCGVGYDHDLDKVERVAVDAITSMAVSDTPVEFFYSEFGDSSIDFSLRFWLRDIAHEDYLRAKSDAVKTLKKAFDMEEINIPFPIRTLEFKSSQFNKALGHRHQRNGSDTNTLKSET